MKTILKDRTLWYDGTTTTSERHILELVKNGKDISNIYVDTITPLIKKYNSFVQDDEKIIIKEETDFIFNIDWNLPNSIKELNVEQFVERLLNSEFDNKINNFSDDEKNIRKDRVVYELNMFKNNGLYDVVRTIIYVINTFREKNVVWGVGRGSSVSSYVLYLIGVHDIDSVEYNLDLSEFIH